MMGCGWCLKKKTRYLLLRRLDIDKTIKYDATINLEEEPIKEGYIFFGWSEIPETIPLYDIEVRGTFSVNPTGIDGVKSEDTKSAVPMKRVENGQLVIDTHDGTYTTSGVRLR